MSCTLVVTFKSHFKKPSPVTNSRVHVIGLLILLLYSVLLGHMLSVSKAVSPSFGRISPLPPVYVADYKGELFDVDIEISGVENVYRCEFTITYDSTLLSAQQVSKGNFFPNDTWFYFNVNEPSGLIDVNISLSELQEPLNGSGVLARLSFQVREAPLENAGSPLEFLCIHLYDHNSVELDYKSVSAIFFWRSVQPKELDGERQVDLYTQKGGQGPGKSSGWFGYGSIVILKAYASFGGWPEQNALVAFQVLNPLNETAFIIVNETDEFGVAETSFRIPEVPESVGVWTVISSVDVACIVVWDTLTFTVSTPVGGETLTIEQNPGYYLYLAVVGVLAVGFAVSKRMFNRTLIHQVNRSL